MILSEIAGLRRRGCSSAVVAGVLLASSVGMIVGAASAGPGLPPGPGSVLHYTDPSELFVEVVPAGVCSILFDVIGGVRPVAFPRWRVWLSARLAIAEAAAQLRAADQMSPAGASSAGVSSPGAEASTAEASAGLCRLALLFLFALLSLVAQG